MVCISRIVNETSHHQGWESNTLRKGSQAKDILHHYLTIPSHSLSIKLCSLSSILHMIIGSLGAEAISELHLCSRWNSEVMSLMRKNFCTPGMLMMPGCSQEGWRNTPLLKCYSTAELKVCLLVSVNPSQHGFGHGHLRNMCMRYCNQTVHSSAHRRVSTLENASPA